MRTIKRAPRGAAKRDGLDAGDGGDGPGGDAGGGAGADAGHPTPDQRDDGTRPFTRANKILLGIASGVLAVLVIGSLVHLPYAIESPGPTVNTLGEQNLDGKQTALIAVSDLPTYPTQGALKFTTVSLAGGPGYPVNAWDVLGAWLDPNRVVTPVDQLFPPQASKEQVAEVNAVQMQGSQQEATAVALRAIGKTVPTHIVVAGFSDGSKATTLLKAGDQFVKVGATTITTPASLLAAVQTVRPGQPLDLVVSRGGQQRAVTVTTIMGDQGKTALGVYLGLDHDFPAKITINAGNVGGPSAGLMFSLGIYDKLTPGSLTGNHQIAGTGTINEQADVGPIGGIQQKMVGARNGGADFFLAPAANCNEVVGHIPDGLQVFKVSTFDQAKTAVEAIAKGQTGPLPHC